MLLVAVGSTERGGGPAGFGGEGCSPLGSRRRAMPEQNATVMALVPVDSQAEADHVLPARVVAGGGVDPVAVAHRLARLGRQVVVGGDAVEALDRIVVALADVLRHVQLRAVVADQRDVAAADRAQAELTAEVGGERPA